MSNVVIVILSHKLNKDDSLTDESRHRVESGVRLFKEMGARKIVVSGGTFNFKEGVSHSQRMKEYAIELGIKPEFVFEENYSTNTIEQAILTKFLFFDNNKDEIVVVSSNYHMSRVSKVFNFVFGDDRKIRYFGCPETAGVVLKRFPHEQASLWHFIFVIRNIKFENTRDLLKKYIIKKKQGLIGRSTKVGIIESLLN